MIITRQLEDLITKMQEDVCKNCRFDLYRAARHIESARAMLIAVISGGGRENERKTLEIGKRQFGRVLASRAFEFLSLPATTDQPLLTFNK